MRSQNFPATQHILPPSKLLPFTRLHMRAGDALLYYVIGWLFLLSMTISKMISLFKTKVEYLISIAWHNCKSSEWNVLLPKHN